MIRYFAPDMTSTRPEAVECATARFPHQDAKGRVQYVNTHFDTEQQAWQSMINNAAAGVKMSRHDLERAEKVLAAVSAELKADLERQDEILKNYAAWTESLPVIEPKPQA